MSSNFSIFAFILVFLSGSIGFQDDFDRDFIIAELIHRDSSISPFYNSSKTASEVLREAITRSLDRINSFNSSLHFGGKDVVSMMIPDKEDYLMEIKDGSLQKFLLMASTGIAFTWIYSNRYDDTYHKVDAALFDPYSADGYKEIPHDSRECRDLPDTDTRTYSVKSILDPKSDVPICEYTNSYRQKVSTRGIFSRGKFHLDSTPFSLLFGCCHQSYKSTLDSRIQGMAGLGHGNSSLISGLANDLKIKKQFSYCLLPLGTANPSKLIFGKKVEFSEGGVSIPFKTLIGSPYYFLTLKRVSVLAKETKETQTLQTEDNMIIDCGTLITSLDPTIFEEVKHFVRNSLDITPLKEDENNPFKLCYNKRDTTNVRFPRIKLYFDGERSITLKPKNIFIDLSDEMVCMMIVPSKGELSVLGNLAQVGFEIEYDLEINQISFAPSNDCKQFGIS